MKETRKQIYRLLSLLLALLTACSLFLLYGCEEKDKEKNGEKGEENASENQPKPYDDWQETVFFQKESKTAFSFCLPWAWDVWQSGDSAILYKDGEEIGKIGKYYGGSHGQEYQNTLCDGFLVERKEYLDQGKRRFFISISENETQTDCYIALDIKADALCEEDKDFIFDNAGAASPSYLDMFYGTLPSSGEILILGNSFVAFSEIGSYFRALLQAGRKSYTVNAVSKEYASVSRYADENGYGYDVQDDLRNGRYVAVFLCGFYSEADVEALPTIMSLCQEGGTPLVLFPAHNEGAGLWQKAVENTNIDVLPWQKEINALIDEGLATYRDFCVDDAHNHSTALAGYVGASMLYRAVCGEMPPRSFYGTSLSSQQIENYLDVYMERGNAGSNFDIPLYVLEKMK
ncbi:MAG: hypothetical protein J6K61_00865 [Clostridia bacterium]|nr:hypothetical protein [Clostridia bacterium]